MKFIEKIIVAKTDNCVPAVLEMVLKHYQYDNYTQDDIAEQFDITPSIDEANPELWGIIIKKDTLNNFFSSNNISLREEFISINMFMDEYLMAERIKQLLADQTTIICGYNYSWLFGEKDNCFGHVSIITEISPNCDKIKIIDPGPKDFGCKWVDSYALFCAIKARKDGLWCIK